MSAPDRQMWYFAGKPTLGKMPTYAFAPATEVTPYKGKRRDKYTIMLQEAALEITWTFLGGVHRAKHIVLRHNDGVEDATVSGKVLFTRRVKKPHGMVKWFLTLEGGGTP